MGDSGIRRLFVNFFFDFFFFLWLLEDSMPSYKNSEICCRWKQLEMCIQRSREGQTPFTVLAHFRHQVKLKNYLNGPNFSGL